MTRSIGLVCLLTSILSVTPAADASVSYTYAAAPTTLSAAPGSVGYDIFLHETLTDGSASIVAADGGVNGAAFRIERVSGSGVGISDLTIGPGFDASSAVESVAADAASLLENSGLGGGAGAGLVGNRVLLGTAWFTGTGAATFSIERYADSAGWVTTAERSLDDPSATAFTPLTGGQTFAVTIPEPATVAAFLPMILLVRRRV